jgi:hypothetical protein
MMMNISKKCLTTRDVMCTYDVRLLQLYAVLKIGSHHADLLLYR